MGVVGGVDGGVSRGRVELRGEEEAVGAGGQKEGPTVALDPTRRFVSTMTRVGLRTTTPTFY